MNILVIDDNQTILRQHELNINKWGHKVYTAANGLKAYEMLESTQIDIIVCDWMMPEMDGLELCKIVRSKDFSQYIYFIIVSSKNNHEDIIHALNTGADDYIVKPVCYDELRS
ncbi:MAG: response regulator, partial [Deltaproteobacteria bacterium]|nr:response regulator [Deltaproteobacteria bacterium]